MRSIRIWRLRGYERLFHDLGAAIVKGLAKLATAWLTGALISKNRLCC
ncbi:hypothetical protein VPHD249_0196 [Vibrio phage D249]|nr:hypothetical protein SIPHO036v1_20003 [Vibrio phage 70E38.1]QZI88256.1 hypothetical protein SIPHO035v1_p0165 [Vibrio phage 234P7B]